MVKNPVNAAALVCVLLLYSGVLKPVKRNPFVCMFKDSEISRLTGTVVSNPVKNGFVKDTYRAVFSVEKVETISGSYCSAKGNITVYFPQDMIEQLYPGKLYTSNSMNGTLVEKGAVLTLNAVPLKKQGLEHSFKAEKIYPLGWNSSISKFRGLCRLKFKRLMYEWKEAGGLLLALVSGSREYTEKSVSDAFRNSGLSHILALSGMHLSLFGGLAFLIGKKFSSKGLAEGIQLLAVSFFVLFAGISPSLFRAFLGSFLIFLSSLFRINKPDEFSVLSLTFLLHSMIYPEHIMDAGFMLSYSSLAGILLFSKIFMKLLPVLIPFKIKGSLAASCSAQLATAPVSLKLFGKIMPIGIIASLIVSPLVIAFLYLGLAGILISILLPFLSGPLSVIMNVLYKIIKTFVLFFSRFS